MYPTKRDIASWRIWRAGFERAGCWLLVVLAGVVLMVALMAQQQKVQQRAIQQQALTLSLQTLQDAIATDISMGVEIEDNPRIEPMLTRMLQSNPGLQSANVMNQHGRIIYSSNRAQLQTQLPAQLLSLIEQQPDQEPADHSWQLQWGNWWLTGVAIHNAHAEEVGHVFLSRASVEEAQATHSVFSTELMHTLGLSVIACAAVGLGVIALLGIQAQKSIQRTRATLQITQDAIARAQHQIQQGFDELDRLEQKE